MINTHSSNNNNNNKTNHKECVLFAVCPAAFKECRRFLSATTTTRAKPGAYHRQRSSTATATATAPAQTGLPQPKTTTKRRRNETKHTHRQTHRRNDKNGTADSSDANCAAFKCVTLLQPIFLLGFVTPTAAPAEAEVATAAASAWAAASASA